jgi:hypothetical protein
MCFDFFLNIVLNLIKLKTLYLCFLKSVYNFKRGEEKMNIFEEILSLNFFFLISTNFVLHLGLGFHIRFVSYLCVITPT